MIQAYYTGISGIKSNQTGIDVVADNLANISTVGFRGNNVEFASLFEESLNTDASTAQNSIGMGSRVNATSMMQTSGAQILTDKSTDLAIEGDGWFGVVGNNETLYTRAGDFIFDANNDLVTIDGMFVLGTMADNIEGKTLSAVVDETLLGDVGTQETLRFPKSLYFPPQPTENTAFLGNLGVKDELRTFGTTVVDKENNKNHLKLEFTQSKFQIPPGLQWDAVATVTDSNNETIFDTKEGLVSFDAKGVIISSTLESIDNNGSMIDIDLGEGYTGLTSTNAPASSGSNISDGTVGGDLVSYEISKNAEIIATFTNGKQSSVGKIALYHFQNDRGLERLSGTRYQESSNSGRASFFQDENGQNILGADVKNYKLEGSNVLMAESLTELIIFQRSFDANSKSISTADEMIQKALSMGA